MRPSLFGMTIAHPSYQIPPNPHGLVEATNEVGLEFLSIVVGIRWLDPICSFLFYSHIIKLHVVERFTGNQRNDVNEATIMADCPWTMRLHHAARRKCFTHFPCLWRWNWRLASTGATTSRFEGRVWSINNGAKLRKVVWVWEKGFAGIVASGPTDVTS